MHTPSETALKNYRAQLLRFVTFTEGEWEIFAPHLYLRSIPKKMLFCSAEKVCTEVGLITKGAFRLYHIREGVEVSNYFCFQQELISSYSSFLKQTAGGIIVEAMEDSEVICFTHASLQALLADARIAYKMERFGRMVAEYLICCYEERVFSFVTLSPEQRYLQLLDKQPAFLQLVPQHYLANYLGITPVSLSRIRKRIFADSKSNKMAS